MNYVSNIQTETKGRSLPNGWQWVKLGEICEFTYGESLPARARQSDGKIPVYGSNGIVGYHEQAITGGPTIIIGRKGSIGEVHFSEVGCFPIDTTYYVERPKLDTDLTWLFHCLKYLKLQNLNRAAAVPGLNRGDAYALDIPLPPLDEQRRIARQLNEQLAAVAAARKAAEEQLHAANELPSAYLQELFGDTAKHKWNWQKLGEVCELLPSNTIKSIGDTVVTAITTACLSENGFLPAGLKTSRMDAKAAKQALVREGEILIARSNTPDLVGRVSIYPGSPPNVVASDLTIRIWAGSACHPPFLTAYLSYLYLSGYWKEMAGGASGSMKKITRTQVLDVKIPVPDIETQKKTVAEMQSKMDSYRQLTQSLESQLVEIESLPASLLREAFAGQG